jgi:hypothetical protein
VPIGRFRLVKGQKCMGRKSRQARDVQGRKTHQAGGKQKKKLAVKTRLLGRTPPSLTGLLLSPYVMVVASSNSLVVEVVGACSVQS